MNTGDKNKAAAVSFFVRSVRTVRKVRKVRIGRKVTKVKNRVPGITVLALLLAFTHTNTAIADSGEAQRTWQSTQMLDSAGDTFTLEELSGKLVLVNFMFTSCRDICPIQTATLKQVMKTLGPEELAHLVFLSISIDPARDTPEVLAEYKRSHEIDNSAWVFSTGTETSIETLKTAFDTSSDSIEALNHRPRYHLLDRQGRLLLSYDSKLGDVNRISRDLKNAIAHL